MTQKTVLTAEEVRLEQSHSHQVHWKRWGPYLSERQWGTDREDYSPVRFASPMLPASRNRWEPGMKRTTHLDE